MSEMDNLSSQFSWYHVKYEDGREDAFMVDRLHARGTYRSLFGEGVVEIIEIDEAECRRRWEVEND